jgi:hypothetical protein
MEYLQRTDFSQQRESYEIGHRPTGQDISQLSYKQKAITFCKEGAIRPQL